MRNNSIYRISFYPPYYNIDFQQHIIINRYYLLEGNGNNKYKLSSQSTKKNRNKFISTIHTKSNYNSTFQQP